VPSPAESSESLRKLDRQIKRNTRGILREILPRTRREAPRGKWRGQAQAVLDQAHPTHLTHHLLRRVERHDLKVTRGLSFMNFMVQESESRRLGIPSAPWLLDQKLAAYHFLDAINVRRPKTDLVEYKFSDLPKEHPAVIKPVRSTGSRSCYLVFSPSKIIHVLDGEEFSSWLGMEQHARNEMSRKQQRPLPDRWFIEELVLEDHAQQTPAPDLKFFTFYGQVEMILEVRRLGGNSRYSFRLPDRTPVIPGSWKYEYFEGEGASPAHLEVAKQVSMEIPHPFARIDMLKGEDGLVFGELTPRPGGFHRFSDQWDRRFGEAWVAAQHRLNQDLLHGKRFTAYHEAVAGLSLTS